MEMSPSIGELAKALAAAQAEMKNPPKDGENPHFNSRFATLAAVRDAVIPVLAKHGLALIQSTGSCEQGPILTSLLMHASGEWVRSDPMTFPAVKRDPQGFASALSYLRRYALMALAGVVGDDDDDGQEAGKPAPAKAAKPQPQGNGKEGGKKPAPPPKDGAELEQRLLAFDGALSGKGLCQPGDLVAHVKAQGVAAGYVPEIVRWSTPAIKWAVEEARAFEQRCKAGQGPVHVPA